MNNRAKLAFNILDHAWTHERLEKIEKEALASFNVVARRDKTSDPSDGRGRLIIPVAPADLDEPHVQIDPDLHSDEPVESGARDGNTPKKASKPTKPNRTGSTEPGTRTRSTEDDSGFDFPL